MGSLTTTTFLTVDGVMQAPGNPDEDRAGDFPFGGWSFPYFSEAKGDVVNGFFDRAACFLLGRTTYEIFGGTWPNFPVADHPVARALNALPKYVVSRSRPDLGWGPATHLSGDDLRTEVGELKDRYDGEIQVHGSAGLVQALHALGLIDEYRLIVDPIVLGTGKRLFEPGAAPAALHLVDAVPLPKGSMLATYRPAGTPGVGAFQMEEGFGSARA
jgi:dihydrofolate reductase